jgi:hypothetical protein
VYKGLEGRWWADAAAILTGAVAIAILVPFLQWLDRGAMVNNAEMDVPNPVGVSLLLALVVINAFVFIAGRTRLFSARTLIILYMMLAAGLPFCSTGLVSQFYAGITGVASEYLDRQIPTIKLGYETQKPAFAPKVEPEVHEEYLRLFEVEQTASGEDPRARQRQLLLPLKRYWSGVYVDPAVAERFENPAWSRLDRAWRSFQSIPWSIWLPPLLSWGAFFALIVFGMACLAQILQRDWTEHENLPFPAAQLPAALLEEESAFPPVFANGWFWSAAAVGAILLLLGGLAHYKFLNIDMATQPVTFQRIDFRYVFARQPWNILQQNMLIFSPLLVGTCYLVHKEILRGVLWVFLALQGLRFFTGIFETPIRTVLGSYWRGNAMPYYPELGTGAVLVFAAFLLWRSRGALMGRAQDDSGDHYLPPRLASYGLAISIVGMAVFWYFLGAAGLGGLVVLLFSLVWTLVGAVAVARLRAEGGWAHSSAHFIGARFSIMSGGSRLLAYENLFAFGHIFALTGTAFPGLLATQLEGIYLARRRRLSLRRLAAAAVVGFIVALTVGLLTHLVLSYWQGSQNLAHHLQNEGKRPFWDMFTGGQVHFDRPLQLLNLLMLPAGAAIMAALLYFRRRNPRFPLPPVCFVIVCLATITIPRGQTDYIGVYSGSELINYIWGPMLIALIAKSLILRYGGMNLYIKSTPAAIGLIFSHVMMVVAWNIYHAVAQPSGALIYSGIL